MIIRREPLMWRILKSTAHFVGIVLLICIGICAAAVTIEFIMWIMDLHCNC